MASLSLRELFLSRLLQRRPTAPADALANDVLIATLYRKERAMAAPKKPKKPGKPKPWGVER
jgi:hypothetical protein